MANFLSAITSIDGALRLLESGTGSDFVGIVAPAAITTSYTLTLPETDSSGTQALVSNGSGVLSWSSFAASIHTHTASAITSGAIQLQYGGTGNNLDSVTAWSSLIVDAGNKISAIAPNTSTTRKYWGMTGTGSAGQVPTWTQPGFSELSGSASLASQVSGVLPIANGGTNAVSQFTLGLAYYSGTSITTTDDIRRISAGVLGLSEASPSVVALRLVGHSLGSAVYSVAGDLDIYTSSGTDALALSASGHLYIQASGSTVFDCHRVAGTNYIAFFGATPVAKQAHIADPSGGSTVDSEARTAINAALLALETYGLLATS
jgi:trimeric autotransporter adhesin